MIRILLFLLTANVYILPLPAQMNATDLLNKSIDFHDPQGQWDTFKGTLELKVIRTDKADAIRKVMLNNAKQKFIFRGNYEEGILTYRVENDKASFLWDGNSEVDKSLIEKYRLSKERASMYKNYFTYLYGMPMKLKDPGTHIDPQIVEVDFYGKALYKMKVTYEPEVGTDSWYFYFNKGTYALEAYQFFKDESKNDGEYILFEGLKEIEGINFPKDRKWYYNKDEKYLATDSLY